MTTATISTIPARGLSARPIARRTVARTASASRAVVLSILGNILLVAVAALAALVVPIAAALAFGPALLSLL